MVSVVACVCVLARAYIHACVDLKNMHIYACAQYNTHTYTLHAQNTQNQAHFECKAVDVKGDPVN